MTQSLQTTERLHALDALRAMMMLLGLVLHSALPYGTVRIAGYTDPEAGTEFAEYVVGYIHVFRMPIFFILAGFFAALLYYRRGARSMGVNRIKRILLPFVVALVILSPLHEAASAFTRAATAGSLENGFSAFLQRLGSPSAYLPAGTGHLWFLYVLLYLYVGFLLFAPLVGRLPASVRTRALSSFRQLARHPVLRILIPGALVAPLLFLMGGWLRTSNSLRPDFFLILTYGAFFAFGCLLYHCRHELTTFPPRALLLCVLGTLLALCVPFLGLPAFHGAKLDLLRVMLIATAGAFAAWLMFFGLAGLFLKHLDHRIELVAYLVAASYWVYLVHSFFALLLPGFVAGTELNVWTRWGFVLGLTTLLSFLTYNLFVRSTFIGRALTGKSYPRDLASRKPIAN